MIVDNKKNSSPEYEEGRERRENQEEDEEYEDWAGMETGTTMFLMNPSMMIWLVELSSKSNYDKGKTRRTICIQSCGRNWKKNLSAFYLREAWEQFSGQRANI